MKKTPFRIQTHNTIIRKLTVWIPPEHRSSGSTVRIGYYPHHAVFITVEDVKIRVMIKSNMTVDLLIERRNHFGQPFIEIYNECVFKGSDIAAKDFDEPKTKATTIADDVLSIVKEQYAKVEL